MFYIVLHALSEEYQHFYFLQVLIFIFQKKKNYVLSLYAVLFL